MKITFTKKSVKAINKWLKRNGFNTTCTFVKGDELAYDADDDLILIPKHYNSEPDSLFVKCLRNLGLASDFDAVTLSILHELGHAQTFPLFTLNEWNAFDVKKLQMSIVGDPEEDSFYTDYWEVKDELAANTWATMYANLFENKVQKLENIIEENVKFG